VHGFIVDFVDNISEALSDSIYIICILLFRANLRVSLALSLKVWEQEGTTSSLYSLTPTTENVKKFLFIAVGWISPPLLAHQQ
jgi:hypothetical protein